MDKFTLKQRIAIKLIFLALIILKPMQYSHEITKPIEDIEKLMRAEVSNE